jgi:hypothetical protein
MFPCHAQYAGLVGPTRARFRHRHPCSVGTRGPPVSAFSAERDLAGSTLYRQATARYWCVIDRYLGAELNTWDRMLMHVWFEWVAAAWRPVLNCVSQSLLCCGGPTLLMMARSDGKPLASAKEITHICHHRPITLAVGRPYGSPFQTLLKRPGQWKRRRVASSSTSFLVPGTR